MVSTLSIDDVLKLIYELTVTPLIRHVGIRVTELYKHIDVVSISRSILDQLLLELEAKNRVNLLKIRGDMVPGGIIVSAGMTNAGIKYVEENLL